MSPKVSIIIPVYNAKVYLQNTINSVINQSYKNLEIILVNDASTDSSLKIIKDFAALDDRIIVIDKPNNEGVDAARFSGLERASGDYITFLDADDWFFNDSISTLVNNISKYNVDVVYGNNTRVFSKRFNIIRKNQFKPELVDRVISGTEKDDLFISFFGVNILPVTLWGNLFKKELVKEPLKKSGLKFGEDLALGMQLYYRAKKIVLLQDLIVNYRWGGITSGYQPKFLESSKVLYNIKMNFIRNYHFSQFERTTVVEMINCLAGDIYQLAVYFPKQERNNIEKIKEEMNNPLYKSFEKYKDIPYFKKGDLNTATANLNAEEAYAIACHNRDKFKEKVKRIIKNIALVMLKYVKL